MSESDIMRQSGYRSRTALESYFRGANHFRSNVTDRVGKAKIWAIAGGLSLLTSLLCFWNAVSPPWHHVDGCGFVDIDRLGAVDAQGTDYRPDALRWTAARGLGLAYHVRESGIWLVTPLAVVPSDRDLPLLALDESDVRKAASERVGSLASAPRTLSSSSYGVIEMDGDGPLRDRSLRLDLEKRYEYLGTRLEMADCLGSLGQKPK